MRKQAYIASIAVSIFTSFSPCSAKQDTLPLTSENGVDELLAPVLDGLVLIGNQNNLEKHGLEKMKGFHVFDISDPMEIEELRRVVEPTYLNKPLRKSTLQELKQRLSSFFAAREKPQTLVLVPGQELADGVLHFVVVDNHEGLLAVADEAFPKMPLQPELPPAPEEQIMIPSLNGIVLVGNPSEIKEDGLRHLDGIFVVDVNIPGGAQHLRKYLAGQFIGEPLTQKKLKELKSTLLNYFKERRMPVVSVQVPEQDITGGVIQLLVIQGKLGKVKAVGNKWTKSARLEEYIRLNPGDDIDESVVIEDLSFMNRNPFRRTDVIYAPGSLPGTTDIELLTEDRRPLRIYAGGENTGTVPTDRGRLLAGLNWGNVFGLDHVFSYQYTASPDFHKFQAHTVQYTAPLPIRHVLVAFGGVSFVHPKIPIHHMRSHGYGVQGSMRYDIPLKPTQAYLHEFSLGFDFKRTNNTVEFSEGPVIFGSNVNLTQLVLGYNAAWDRDTSKTTLDGELYWSPGKWLPDQTDSDFSSLRPGAKNHYIYGLLSAVHIIRLIGGSSLSLLGRGQISTQNLLPSEEFGLGGHDSVRGYDEREKNADNALLLSGELRSPVWHLIKRGNRKPKDELQLLAFLDYGLGILHKNTPGYPRTVWLLGAGPGLRYMINPFLSVRADFGVKLHRDRKKTGTGRTRLHFAIVGSF